MILLEVAPSTDGAAPWTNVFFGLAVAVTAVYFGRQLFKVGRDYRARAKQAEIDAASSTDTSE